MSADEDKSMAEAVADLRRRVKELSVSSVLPDQIDQVPDSFVEAVIRTVRRVNSMPRGELEEQIYGFQLNEEADEETKTA